MHMHEKQPTSPDQEAPCAATCEAWKELERAGRQVREAIEHELKIAGLPALAWYEVLAALAAEPSGALLQVRIEERLELAQYNLSRLIDRLEGAGLVARKPCTVDGRRIVVVITDTGRALAAEMRPVHERAVQRHIGTRLAPTEAHALAALLAKLRG